MGLRDMLRAIQEYPAALAELRRTQQALVQSEQTYVALRDEAGERANHERFLTRQLAALQAALKEFCPRLSSLEDMKRFYDTISPSMDPQGFTLYHILFFIAAPWNGGALTLPFTPERWLPM